jgi:tripartite ATP-independent transporter DctM subunit
VPGLLIGASLMLFVHLWCRFKGLGKADGDDRLGVGPATRDAGWALLMPVVILGGIYGGIFTPTEASVIAVAYALVVSVIVYRELTLRQLWQVLRRSTLSSAVIMFIISMAGLFSFVLTRAGVPAAIGEWIVSNFDSRMMFLLAVNGFLFLIGMFVETSASIVVLAPILAPVAMRFGIDPVHFGMIMIVNLAMGMITPPFGVNLFAASAVAGISLDRMVRHLLPMVVLILCCLALITYVPAISLGSLALFKGQ